MAETESSKPKSKEPKKLVVLAVVSAVVIAGIFIVSKSLLNRGLPEGLIQANGRIEGDNVAVASKFPGRIAKLYLREGSAVTNGQALAQLDDSQVATKVAQARAAVAAIEAQLEAVKTGLQLLKKDVPLGIEIAESSVIQARSVIGKSEAADQQASRDAGRYRELLEQGTVEKHKSEQADLAATVTKNDLAAAQTALTRAGTQLAQAKLGSDRITVKEKEIVALEAQLAQTRAALAEAESVQSDLSITAPIDGIITTRVRDVGEVVAGGSPLFNLVDLNRLYLKVYVPESQIGKLRLGLPARIYTDAFPKQPLNATVRYIASRAEFTPKEVQTPDERVKLVYAVKLYLDENPEHRFTPGLPADAVIRWKEGVAWKEPRW
jgi:HlyD family secretion protein